MFVDASAMVAIMSAEPPAAALIRCLDQAEAPITSALAVFETVMALSRKLSQDVANSESQIERFLLAAGIRLVPIAAAESHEALAAHARYGKGRGHPAQLNLGDCFAYACAQVHDVPLLFVGDDFPQTDIRSAMA
ncbi:type II toxin-antitoxin system VapC family toxin [Methylobacterium sp. E-041]|jgi:ribonuclease VapC|uniref:type II toxin-antitoxin system VapC family toxin n=1 Tax=unclassified Methylobacterium TaxID=2615210 RepID=UPI0011CA8167|nr:MULTISPECIES: type II toxin-antitoxin system VapC family toxin [unclassified Methylobacterium]MCJ2007534.1 type II toxin-antitoxin system VapC family toxin [Methylobacterium sp. J-092]MCJ2041310.1 type II toxin-antitoxin system VapC family toxin [Methylobacterium sp. J-059]MCJ2076988.1 type II toxin-antitoxin system VapC family toxin [Methylobacterium sp. E-016]MCJ2104494.1 type II toxin-antitoxin system VapC family toxin [Methylobacterium sp. E-041]TXM88740.1 type II toxin-antitoxin system